MTLRGKLVEEVWHEISRAVEQVCARQGRPVVVALDGGSGAGKSTLARLIQRRMHVALVCLDDFYTTTVPESDWERQNVEERLHSVFAWERVRQEALIPLRAGLAGRWNTFDYAGGLRPDGTYGPARAFTEVLPAPVILLEGSYSASPPLDDLLDLTVLVNTPVAERHRRTDVRDEKDPLAKWHAIWDEVEAYYFTRVRPPGEFDLVVSS